MVGCRGDTDDIRGSDGIHIDDISCVSHARQQCVTCTSAVLVTSSEPPVVPLAREKSNNYASMDCGAKMVGWSKDSQNPGAVLIENKDIYMLSPCSADIW